MSQNSSIGVSFKVSGGDLESYLSKIQQRAQELSREFIRNAEKESDLAEDNIKSYDRQIKSLKRKMDQELEFKKIQAEINRDNQRDHLRNDIKSKRDVLDGELSRGEITKKQHRLGNERLAQEEEKRNKKIDDQYRTELAAHRDQKTFNNNIVRELRASQDAIRATSAQELNQMRKGDESLVDAVKNDDDPQKYIANKLASQQFIEEQAKEAEKKKGEGKENTFQAFLKAMAIEKVGGMVAQMPHARDSIDFIKPISSAIGMLMGFLPGQAIDIISGLKLFGTGAGQTNLSGLGMQLGEKVGEFAGDVLTRTYRSRQELTASNYKLQALTGMNLDVEGIGQGEGMGGRGYSKLTRDLQEYGIAFKEASELQYKIAKAQGDGRSLYSRVEDLAALRQGLGIEESTYLGLSELLRSSKEGNKDVLKLVGGVASAGKNNIFAQDRTFLSEFMEKNFTGLQKTLLQTQNHVASGATFDILKRFDSIGGPFAARDSRSTGLINTIQNSLVNPGSDNVKALAFLALREQNPNMDFYQLMEEQQKGLASPTYLKTMIQNVDRLGGSEDFKMRNLAGLLGLEQNLAANRLIWQNRDKLLSGEISTEELLGIGEYSREGIQAKGKMQTDVYTVENARFANAFIEGATEGLKAVKDGMAKIFGNMGQELAEYLKAEVEKMKAELNKPAPTSVAANTTVVGRGHMFTNDGKVIMFNHGPKY